MMADKQVSMHLFDGAFRQLLLGGSSFDCDFSTTANVYAHLDYNSKLSSADAMAKGLSGALGVIS